MKLADLMMDFVVACIFIQTFDFWNVLEYIRRFDSCCREYWIRVQVFVKHYADLMSAFVNTSPGMFILFMVLSATIVKLECDKIDHQERLGYCKKFEDFKCENGGIRIYNKENGSSCWCTPDYVGEHCQREKPVSFMSRIISLFRLGNSDVSRGRPTMWWSIIPFTSGLQLETIYAFHQSAVKSLENGIAGTDDGHAARILPPACPLECCANDKTLPSLKTLYDEIFKRKPGQFIPERNNRHLLFDAFYQYFVLQFFNADSDLTVTASQLYGSDPVSERSMKSFSSGKLKTLSFNGKNYARKLAFILPSDVSLKALPKGISTVRSWLSKMTARIFKPAEMSSTSPMLFVMSTLWVREHNRVCDELSQKWPSWTDEELYTTARKIVTGQMMTIMMNEILNLELRPEVYHHRMKNISGSGTPIELYLTMAVSILPEKLQYNSTNLTFSSNTGQILEADFKDALKFMTSSKMGVVATHNDGALTESITKTLMTLSRENCLQGFNEYRRRLGLRAYNSFFDLTGNVKTAKELKKLYGTVEKVELLTGMLTEVSSPKALPTKKVLSNSFIINAILTNTLTTKHSWVPGTFGGVEFFDRVKSTSLKSLVTRNVEDELQVQLSAK